MWSRGRGLNPRPADYEFTIIFNAEYPYHNAIFLPKKPYLVLGPLKEKSISIYEK
jgi:hypothetical protein